MSEALDYETESYCERLHVLLDVVFEVAELTRTLGIEEPRFRGGSIERRSTSNYIVEGQELKPNYFLIVTYDGAKGFTPDPFTWYGLEGCLAWILSYHSHHAKWKVEAFSECIGRQAFAKLARKHKEQ